MEHTVDLALQKESKKYEEGSVPKRLPKKMRGRCVPRKIIQAPIWSPCKKAGSGDFNPELECYTIASKRMVKQIRRIQSLRRRLQRTQNYGEIWESTWVAMWEEWASIIRYRHKGLEFLLWALDTPELVPVPNDLPTDEWLLSAQQLLQHDLQHQLFHEHSVHKAKLAMQHEIDRKYGQRKQAFATLRDQVNPPFNKVQRLENDIAIAVATAKGAEYEIYVDNPSRFSKLDPLQINGHEAKITSFDQDFLTIRIISAHESLPEEVEINQMVFKYQVQDVFAELTNYWTQYWQRGEAVLPDSLPEMIADLPTFQVKAAKDINLWKKAIHDTKPNSAPGFDGITISELRMLPVPLLESLIQIVNDMPSFPEWIMRAKTVPLPKGEIFAADMTRPITILPTIYRLWSKVCMQEILQKLANFLPPAITGMLPHRGALSACYDLQVMLEKVRSEHSHLAGLTLDLRKCFNLVNRSKAKKKLHLYAFPAEWIDKWYTSLTCMQRYWKVQQAVSQWIPADTGIPEGDPWSVAIMIVIAAEWIRGNQKAMDMVGNTAYADNWSVWYPVHDNPEPLIQHTLDFTTFMGLEIDWKKTWLWSTNGSGHKKLQKVLRNIVPEGAPASKNNACDLGCQVTYYGNPRLGSLHQRFNKAKKRLQRLKHLRWDLTLKKQMIFSCVMPAAFYGAEIVYIGQSHFDSLRTAIAQALVGETAKSMNPAIFLHCADSNELDPQLFVILQAIKQARLYLFRADDEDRKRFLQVLATPTKNSRDVKGPASALREYLLIIGWTCSNNGIFNLTNTNLVTLCNHLFQS